MRMTIGGRAVGGDAPLFVVAEIGLNHGGSVDEALALVDAAAEAGASAVKLQSLRGDFSPLNIGESVRQDSDAPSGPQARKHAHR